MSVSQSVSGGSERRSPFRILQKHLRKGSVSQPLSLVIREAEPLPKPSKTLKRYSRCLAATLLWFREASTPSPFRILETFKKIMLRSHSPRGLPGGCGPFESFNNTLDKAMFQCHVPGAPGGGGLFKIYRDKMQRIIVLRCH